MQGHRDVLSGCPGEQLRSGELESIASDVSRKLLQARLLNLLEMHFRTFLAVKMLKISITRPLRP